MDYHGNGPATGVNRIPLGGTRDRDRHHNRLQILSSITNRVGTDEGGNDYHRPKYRELPPDIPAGLRERDRHDRPPNYHPHPLPPQVASFSKDVPTGPRALTGRYQHQQLHSDDPTEGRRASQHQSSYSSAIAATPLQPPQPARGGAPALSTPIGEAPGLENRPYHQPTPAAASWNHLPPIRSSSMPEVPEKILAGPLDKKTWHERRDGWFQGYQDDHLARTSVPEFEDDFSPEVIEANKRNVHDPHWKDFVDNQDWSREDATFSLEYIIADWTDVRTNRWLHEEGRATHFKIGKVLDLVWNAKPPLFQVLLDRKPVEFMSFTPSQVLKIVYWEGRAPSRMYVEIEQDFFAGEAKSLLNFFLKITNAEFARLYQILRAVLGSTRIESEKQM
ncbi:MAG: hypothetical protein M1819_001201 [Sarea resinae]|nr:MAG: hypothetical protein M1819_001201 [Sarea resinae]